MTYFLLDGSKSFTSIYLKQDDNEKTCTFLSILTMLKTFEIADSNFSVKDESMLKVAGAIGVDTTGMELVEDPRTDVLAEDTPVGLGL